MSRDMENRQNIFKMIGFAYYPNPGTYIYVWRAQIRYLAVFGHVFERAKYGQVGCPEKILQNAVQTQCLGFKMMCAGEILDESR